MTKAENLTYLEKTIAKLKAEASSLIAKQARDGEIRACESELARHEQALMWLSHR